MVTMAALVDMVTTDAIATDAITTDALATDVMTTEALVTAGTIVTTDAKAAEQAEPSEFFDVLSGWLFLVVLPIITIVGVTGNSLAIVTVARSSLKSSSVAVYITALAVVDSIVLIMDLLNNWLASVARVDVLAVSHAGCKTYRFVFHVLYTCSAWYVAAMALERFVVVWFPLKARRFCTRRNAVIVCSTIPLLVSLLYTYHIVGWSIAPDGTCNFHPKHMYLMSFVHPWLAGALYSYAPIVLVSFCTLSICLQLTRMKKRRAAMTSQEEMKSGDAERKITVLIVTTCALFIVLTVPMTIYFVILLSAGGHIYQGPVMALLEALVIILVLSNHAINFFLYVLSSEAFRNTLLKMFGCRKGKRGKGNNSSEGRGSTKLSTISGTVQSNASMGA